MTQTTDDTNDTETETDPPVDSDVPVDETRSESVSAAKGDPESVEQYWYRSLTELGADSSTAERLIRAINTHPVLIVGDPSREEIDEIITARIDDIALAEEGIESPDQARREMHEALKEGLAGNIPGPDSLTVPDRIQTGPTDQPTGPGAKATPSKQDEPGPTGTSATGHPTSTDATTTTETLSTMTEDANAEDAPSTDDGPNDATESFTPSKEELEAANASDASPAAAPGGPATAAGAAGAATEDPQAQQSRVDIDEVDFDDLIAQTIPRELADRLEFDFEELDEDEQQRLRAAAGLGSLRTLSMTEAHLYGHLDENAREMIFEQTIEEPLKKIFVELHTEE